MDAVYFVWCDTDKKYPQKSKIVDAIAAYERKLRVKASEVLVNAADESTPSPLPTTVASFVKPNYYYIPLPAALEKKLG